MTVQVKDSQSPYFSILSYMKEVELLAKWKVIPLGSFHVIRPKSIHKTYSYRLGDALVRAGIAQKVKCGTSRFQVLVPTEKALDYTCQNFKFSQFTDYCKTSFIASALFELGVFRKKVIRFRHQELDQDIQRKEMCPDFTIEGINSKSIVYQMGVFFEPPHFSRGNSFERMMKITEKGHLDVIVLIFKNLDDLQKRKELYFENRDARFEKSLKEYICLVHIENYLQHPKEINSSYVYFQGEETTLEELFK